MRVTNNTILITGGATGIGFELAKIFSNNGNEVIICGRRKNKLDEAKERIPQLHTKVCDLTKENERQSLLDWVLTEFKDINILINNAGIQRIIDFKKANYNLFVNGNEIETNLVAPIHLSTLFIPNLMKQKESAIINISSGLGFIPLAIMPIYCSTKSALHSLSLSLRYQLRDTSVKVFEIIPPMVDTELDNDEREMRGQTERGIQPSTVALETLKAIEEDKYEYAIGQAENLRLGSRNAPEQIFNSMNK
jgi:uncharacterized oxidoreductase